MAKDLKREESVIVSGRKGTVVFPSLNKVCIRFEDGSEEMVSYQIITKCQTKTENDE